MLAVDLKLLQEFMHLSKDLSFTKTAERCYISQSVLSRHVQALEAELGCDLLIRDKRGIRLTAYGEAFAESCKRIEDEYARALSELENMVGGFTEMLRISYVSPLPRGFIDAAYAMQLERHPQVKLDLMASWEERAIVMLKQDKVDLSIYMTFEDPDPALYSSLVLFEDRYVVLVPEDSALAKQSQVKLKDLEGQKLLIPSRRDFPVQHARITEAVKGFLDMNVQGLLNSKHDAVAFANARRGIPMVRSLSIANMDSPTLKPVPVAESALAFETRAVWKKEGLMDPLIGFIEILKELKESGRFAS